MRKVFTKYDIPYSCIHEPYFDDLVARPLTPDMPIEYLPIKERLLRPVNVEYGLEGVYYVDYAELEG